MTLGLAEGDRARSALMAALIGDDVLDGARAPAVGRPARAARAPRVLVEVQAGAKSEAAGRHARIAQWPTIERIAKVLQDVAALGLRQRRGARGARVRTVVAGDVGELAGELAVRDPQMPGGAHRMLIEVEGLHELEATLGVGAVVLLEGVVHHAAEILRHLPALVRSQGRRPCRARVRPRAADNVGPDRDDRPDLALLCLLVEVGQRAGLISPPFRGAVVESCLAAGQDTSLAHGREAPGVRDPGADLVIPVDPAHGVLLEGLQLGLGKVPQPPVPLS
mmetsp:Transcript_27188/g.86053  ORF Transcript_27188/g.86053 Transcript_27188/m.86053 type:complete len:279 (-) Transcript_27188:220-1056(-)